VTIALCDDDGRFRAQTARSLKDILEKRGIEAEVVKFRCAEDLMKAQTAGASFDLYLLDIVMPGMNGVTLARLLRTLYPTVPILFFTTSADYAVEAFSIGAVHYVVKPFTREQFTAAIDRALALVERSVGEGVLLKTQNRFVKVPFEDIVWSETDEHYQIVHLKDGHQIVSRLSGQDLWAKLEPSRRFVRAGLKYVFNIAQMTGVGKEGVTLAGATVVKVPRRALSEVKAAYMRFCCR